MSKSIQALREQRAAKAREYRNILDNTPANEWNDGVKAKIQALSTDIDDLEDQINAHERLIRLEDDLEARAVTRSDRSGRSVDEEASHIQAEKRIFNAWIRGGVENLSNDDRALVAARRSEASRIYGAQTIGTAAEGGYLAPGDFAATLLERVAAYGGVRSVADVLRTDGGNQLSWATVDETAQEGELVGESASAADGDITFGTLAIDAYKYSSKVVTVSVELLQDSRIDIEPYVSRALAERIARITNKHFTTGTASSQPRGVVTASGQGKVGASGQTTSVTYADLVDLEHSVDPAYRSNASFMMNDATLKALKKLVDGQGRPLWRPGVTGNDPSDILGYRYVINQHMPVMAANAKSILFGDFKKYLIRDVMQVSLFRFADSAYMKKGQVGFLAWSRHDGDLVDASNASMKHYANAAS